jgi:hypothetical protein
MARRRVAQGPSWHTAASHSDVQKRQKGQWCLCCVVCVWGGGEGGRGGVNKVLQAKMGLHRTKGGRKWQELEGKREK